MEEQIRLHAFKWIQEQVERHGDVLPRTLLEKGFIFGNERITLVGPQGIWKPKVFKSIPLSITTVVDGPYNDLLDKEGLIQYRYRGTDINHRDNVGLREAMQKQVPLIYFFGITKGKYLVVWPVFIINDNPENLSFTVAVDEEGQVEQYINKQNINPNLIGDSAYYKRCYLTSTVKQRLHQRSFRERVLAAYKDQCAFCRLRHIELLDATHIIPDSEEKGLPSVNNGLSLCKIHHAAFDNNIIGVTPDYQIIVRNDILQERDGPMLRYGFQQLHEKGIVLPGNKDLWPDKVNLEIRYNRFKSN